MGKESRYQRRGGGRKLDSVGNIVVTGLTWSLSGSCSRVHRLAFFYFLSFLHAFERQKISTDKRMFEDYYHELAKKAISYIENIEASVIALASPKEEGQLVPLSPATNRKKP
jgi:hypothetical protein